MSMDMLLTVAGNKMFEMSELLACLATVAVTCLLFLFVYYCFCNSSREGELLAKLNALERSLLATHKENAILKEDLVGTRNKLSSIEDNSFGSNDMVISLKKELEEELLEKRQLQEQVGSLEKVKDSNSISAHHDLTYDTYNNSILYFYILGTRKCSRGRT